MKFIWLLFFLFSAVHVTIAYLLPSFIENAHFPYDDLLYKYFALPPFTAFANFDGYQYMSIAKIGYKELQQSYFPLFPALVAVVEFVIPHYLVAGIIVSWLCLLGGLVFFKKYIGIVLPRKNILWAILLLLTFPSSFFYQVVYPESLFLLVATAALYFLLLKKYLWASVFAVLASLTKVQGVLLLIPFVSVVLEVNKLFAKRLTLRFLWEHLQKHLPMLVYAFAPLYGLLLYAAYLWITTGDPFYFYHAQTAFGAQRSVDTVILLPQVLYRYIKIFFTAQLSFTYLIALLEFVLFSLVFGVILMELVKLLRQKKKDMHQIGLQLYSITAIVLPTLTGTLTSVPRYALVSIGFFVAMAKVKSRVVKISLICMFACLQIVLFIYFLKGYFIS